jgi:Tfp pilus assembly protein FimT
VTWMIHRHHGLAVGSDATGDVYYRNSSGYLARLAAGSNGHVLTLDSGIPSWAAASGGDITGSTGSTDNIIITANGTGGSTVQANSAVAVDDSSNVTGVGNLTLSGEVDAATGDFSGAVDIAGDLTLSAGADGALRFSAASSIKILDNSATSLVFEEADNAYMTFVTTNSSEAIKFDKSLDINASMDVDADVDISGDLTLSAGADGALRFSAASSIKILDNSATSLVVEEADNAYMTFVTTNSSEAIKFDVGLDVNAAVQIDSTVTVGVDDTGHDVKFFGATSGSSVLFDESADDMILTNYGLAVGSDATGDIYYRNSSGFLARLGAGTNGHFLKQGSSIPEWSAVSATALTGSTATTIPTVTGANAIAGEANLRYDDKILSTDGAAASFDTTFTGVQSEKMFIGGEDGHATNSEWWSNVYYDSSAYKRIGTGEASRYRQQTGTHTWYGAGSASADATITWTTAAYWDSDGNANWYASGSSAFVIATSTPKKPSGGDWSATSDSRLKTVTGEYTLGLTELCNSNVRPVKYQYNGKADTTADGKTYVGLVAQEVEQVFPDTVTQYSRKINDSDANETTDLRQFDGGEIKWALVNAVKELKAELDSAKARITALEA